MEKQNIKLLQANINNKIKAMRNSHQITTIHFLSLNEQKIVTNQCHQQECHFVLYGGFSQAERKMCFVLPNKAKQEEILDSFQKEIVAIRIQLPNELQGEYSHRTYLGALMRLGLKREKIGDILVFKDGCDILLSTTILKFVLNELPLLTRFQKSTFSQICLKEIREPNITKTNIKILVPSLRIDSVLSSLFSISRGKANELIEKGRVFINEEEILKNAKLLREGDRVTVRGKGKFVLGDTKENTRKGKKIIEIIKYEN